MTGAYAYWKVTPNLYYNYIGGLTYTLDNLTSHGTSGTHAFQVTDTAPTTTTRSLCVSQDIYHPHLGLYSFAANIGRIARRDDAKQSIDTIEWEIQLDGVKPYQDECDIRALDDEPTYRKETWSQYVDSEGIHTWAICAVYMGQVLGAPDTFLVDDVEIDGPYGPF
jgi:hypothetical protein